ncbi:PhzF family phenazine biosynthesis protein [Paraburkholderia sp. GAS199]|uniref:PhzF family phenazine biosynthesis protein n=1 Tax=Paraburkholderia sp. GAS199 TaxID=3035126 RepID=UPI003D21F5DB
MSSPHQVELVSVFAAGPGGGNPAPIVVDAAGMSDAQMQQVARHYGHESGFVLPAPPGSGCDYEFRFWVPNHEMSMCGHATVGAVWLLHQTGKLQRDHLTVQTRSGAVKVRITDHTADGAAVEISQPLGRIEPLPHAERSRDEILDALGIDATQLAPLPIQNASTSRVKTLIPLATCAALDALQPRFEKIEALCERIGSTGLYPYASFDAGRQIFDARQFPRASGYPEDAATGIAASALSFGLLANGMVEASPRTITIRQGRAMKRPSQISVRFSFDTAVSAAASSDTDAPAGRPDGCWLGGPVRFETHVGAAS